MKTPIKVDILRKVKSPFTFEDYEIQVIEIHYMGDYCFDNFPFIESVYCTTLVKSSKLYKRLVNFPMSVTKRIPHCGRKWITDTFIGRYQ